MKKEIAIKNIQKIYKENSKESQTEIAIKIINSASNEEEVGQFYNLIVTKVKVGLVFDETPNIPDTKVPVLRHLEKESIEGECQSDILIIGENYDALKKLKVSLRNKIDIIYLDPPYNTESNKSENSKKSLFLYRDKFSRTGWLNLMKERLVLSKEILSDKGVIYVSIDDNEQAYLKVLMDEIFGEENFICNFSRVTNKGKGNDTGLVVKENDYVLMYSKNAKLLSLISMNDSNIENYTEVDEYVETRGKYQVRDISDKVTYSSKLDFPIKDPDGNDVYPGYVDKKTYEERLKNHLKKDMNWRWNFEAIEKGIKEGFAFWKKVDGSWKLKRKIYYKVDKNGLAVNRNVKNTSIIENMTNSSGTKDLNKIIGKNDFTHPKPVALIKYLVSIVENNENAVILDFFAGSGTTGQAVQELNLEDGGSRKYILVTNNENNIAYDITLKRITNSINKIKKESGISNSLNVFDIEYVNFKDD